MKEFYAKRHAEGVELEKKWNEMFDKYAAAYPKEVKNYYNNFLLK